MHTPKTHESKSKVKNHAATSTGATATCYLKLGVWEQQQHTNPRTSYVRQQRGDPNLLGFLERLGCSVSLKLSARFWLGTFWGGRQTSGKYGVLLVVVWPHTVWAGFFGGDVVVLLRCGGKWLLQSARAASSGISLIPVGGLVVSYSIPRHHYYQHHTTL